VLGILILIALRWRMNVMSLPDEEARALGLPTGTLRVVIVAAAHGNLFSRPTAGDREIAARTLERFGISHLSERPYTMISVGERQLCCLPALLRRSPSSSCLTNQPQASISATKARCCAKSKS
jgi:iron complex transport system ATP-binding protein